MAQHLAGVLLDLLERLAEAHAAGPVGIVLEAPGAAAAGMNLRFDHPNGAAELARRVLRLLGREGDRAARHAYAELGEQALGLILVNVHRPSLPLSCLHPFAVAARRFLQRSQTDTKPRGPP